MPSPAAWCAMAMCVVATALSVGAAAPQSTDVHGMARAGASHASDAVVWLDAPNASLAAGRKVVLDQRNLNFSPRVLAVRVGTTVDFPNNDRVFHNVFSFRDGKRFDLGLYPVGSLKRVTFDRPGLSRIFCNIHPNMAAYVMAVDSPYFAVSDAYGAFTIAAVPSGSYTFHAWHAGTTDLTGTWTSTTGQPLTISWP